jgi:hypothetical protein
MQKFIPGFWEWANKHLLAISLAIAFPLWGIVTLLFAPDHSSNLLLTFCSLIPLGWLNYGMFVTNQQYIMGLLLLAVAGYGAGWIIDFLWKWRKWTILFVSIIAIINSCTFLGFALSIAY